MSDLTNFFLSEGTNPDLDYDGSGTGIESLGEDLEGFDGIDLDLSEEAALEEFAHMQEVITEQMNIVRLNRQAKLLNLTNRTALVLAKQNKDPLFAKYARFNSLRLQIRSKIVKKYGAKAAARARSLTSKAATSAPPKK